MDTLDGIYIGLGEQPLYLLPKMANRHGLIAGATGTGKTVTLQGMAEGFSRIGVPVFMADVKGDLAGLSQKGEAKPKLVERAQEIGYADYAQEAFPVVFWDALGEQGHPVRATVSDMGPLLLARLLDLNDTQEGVLNIAFKIADDEGLLMLDLKDLRAMLTFVSENAKAIQAEYGNVSSASVGAIQRALLVVEEQGGERFFGEPALEIADLMRDEGGRGVVNILAADKLMHSPRLYAMFLLWLLSEIFEELPEVGDLEKPKLVFFFDEAHLLFEDAPKALVDKIEQVVRLIRSKGVGVYFVTQNPIDIPDEVLGQLGNRVQHALRAFTPRDQKAVNSAAETFRPNPNLDVRQAIVELGVGEALVSLLDEKGTPSIVQRTLIRPPSSRLGPTTPQERGGVLYASPLRTKYEQVVDRESAYEILKDKANVAAAAAAEAEAAEAEAKREAQEQKALEAEQKRLAREQRTYRSPSYSESKPRSSGRQTILEAAGKSVVRSMGSTLGRQIVRGVLGSIFRGR